MPRFAPFFEPTAAALSPELRAIVEAASIPSLGGGHVEDTAGDAKLAAHLKSSADHLPPLAISGLWLLAGDWDRSHSISQNDSSPEGSFWHGIMHRSEGDYSNAKYWFRRVGKHGVFDELPRIHQGVYSDPFQFVDDVERACRGRTADPTVIGSLIMIQWSEWQLLMRRCMADFVQEPTGSGKKPTGPPDPDGQRIE